MTELEALKMVLNIAIEEFVELSKQLEKGETVLTDAVAELDLATDIVDALIKRVTECETSPESAAALAESVMNENGVYVTSGFHRAWLDKAVKELASRELTDAETQVLLEFCMNGTVSDHDELLYGTIEEWLQNNDLLDHKSVKQEAG